MAIDYYALADKARAEAAASDTSKIDYFALADKARAEGWRADHPRQEPPFDWREAALSSLPVMGAVAGGAIGGGAGAIAVPGLGGVPGVMAGGATGATAGRMLENMGRQAIGSPPNASMTQSAMGAFGHRLPPVLNQPIDALEQAVIGGVAEGLPAKLFGVGGRAGTIDAGLRRIAERGADKVAAQASGRVASVEAEKAMTPGEAKAIENAMVEEARAKALAMHSANTLTPQEAKTIESAMVQDAVTRTRATNIARELSPAEAMAAEKEAVARAKDRARQMIAARDIAPDIAAAEKSTKAAREQAGQAVGKAAVAGKEAGVEVTLGDIADRVATLQVNKYGSAASKPKLLADIRRQLRAVLGSQTSGAISGSQTVFDAGLINIVKRELAVALKPGFKAAEGGITPKPGLQRLMHAAITELEAERVAGMSEANQAAKSAIREHQDVSRMATGVRGPTVRGLQVTRAERAAEAAALSRRAAAPAADATRAARAERVAAARAGATAAENPALADVRLQKSLRAAEAAARHNAAVNATLEDARIRAAQRSAAAGARYDFNNARPQIFHLGMHGIGITPPTGARLALSGARFFEHPSASALSKATPEAINYLLHLLQSQQRPDGSSYMPPDTLR